MGAPSKPKPLKHAGCGGGITRGSPAYTLLLKIGREIGADAERVRWKTRLGLLVDDLKDRGHILKGSTTYEQAYRQAAIDLEEIVAELAAPRQQHPGGPPTPAPSSPSDAQP